MKYSVLTATFFAVFFGPVANANSFEVYCVPSLDGISTCSGWKKDKKIECISSPGGVASCRSSDGEQFTCTQDSSGVTTCGNIQINPGNTQQNCTAIGDGSFSCNNNDSTQSNQRQPSNELDAITDIIGDSTSSPIDRDVPEQPAIINPTDIIHTPSLLP